MKNGYKETEILIVGGGVVGTSIARKLSRISKKGKGSEILFFKTKDSRKIKQ